MECIFEEKMEIVQELVDRGAQTVSLRTKNLGSCTVSGIPFCRKSACVSVTQSQNVSVSCFSQQIGQWPAQAA